MTHRARRTLLGDLRAAWEDLGYTRAQRLTSAACIVVLIAFWAGILAAWFNLI